ncbi:MAG: DUF4297 domain-containing protein [Bdellovibrionales bacterium]|nr:DUF4297 domain-containing protein [Bdellovibrionales bacterium]
MSRSKRLNEVLPREQAGARTPQQYDYQYCQVANECFGLFESSDKLCVFCEWHDDFVTEHKSTSAVDIYAFHQVKTKALNRGPWKLNELFGAGGKGKGLKQDAAFFRMVQNYLVFKEQCRQFVFVTNTGIDADLSAFLQDISSNTSEAGLNAKSQKYFSKIWTEYQPHFNGGAIGDFFQLLKRFQIQAETDHLGEHIKLLRSRVEDRVKEFCEIELKRTHAERIATNIIELIRKRSQHQIKTLPIHEDALQTSKSIKAEDVFAFLPLSKDGLKALQTGNQQIRDNILALSRLHRLCQDSKIPDSLIADICGFKVKWDLWIQEKKHDIDSADLDSIKLECIKALSDNDTSFKTLGERAQDIVKVFNPKLPGHTQVSDTLILGFIFSIASQMERKSDD